MEIPSTCKREQGKPPCAGSGLSGRRTGLVPADDLQQRQSQQDLLPWHDARLLLPEGQHGLPLSSVGSKPASEPRLTCPAPPLLQGRANLGLAVPSTFQVLTLWDFCSEDLC